MNKKVLNIPAFIVTGDILFSQKKNKISEYFELVKFNNYITHTEGQQERGTLSTGTRPIENYLLAIATFFKILVNALFPI